MPRSFSFLFLKNTSESHVFIYFMILSLYRSVDSLQDTGPGDQTQVVSDKQVPFFTDLFCYRLSVGGCVSFFSEIGFVSVAQAGLDFTM